MTPQNNILKVYKQATPEQKKTGGGAYKDYNKQLKALAEFHSFDFKKVAAAFAALSPGISIDRNFEFIIKLCDFIKAEKDPSRLKEIRYVGYPGGLVRAYDIILGFLDFETSLAKNSKKTLSFYHNILNPEGEEHITIDRHMISVYLGRAATETERVKVFSNAAAYKRLAKIFFEVAERLKVKPLELQAVCWYAWRARGVESEYFSGRLRNED